MRQSAARGGLAGLQPLDLACGNPRVWEAAIAAFFPVAHQSGNRGARASERGINACVANEPADVLADPHLAARGFFDTADGLPERFVSFRESPPLQGRG